MCRPDDRNLQLLVRNQTLARSVVLQTSGYCGTQRLYVLFEKLKVDGAGKEKRRSFIKRLGKGLCQELQEQRRSDATLPSLVTARLLDDTEGPPKKRGRCHVCPRQTDKKATAVCKACHTNVCHVQCEVFCTTCLSPN